MSDFEIVERGTIRELELLRNVARAIEQVTYQFGKVIPGSVTIEFEKLKAYYESQDRTV